MCSRCVSMVSRAAFSSSSRLRAKSAFTTSDFENRLSSQVSHALSVRVVLDFILVRFYVADA